MSIWDECSIADENLDGYDDVSYEVVYDTGATSGDFNLDETTNILDIVQLANCVLAGVGLDFYCE